jgi:hypothetical protein
MKLKRSGVQYCVLIVYQVNTKSRTNIGHGRNYSVKHEWNAKDVTQWNEHRRFVRIEFVRRCGRAEEKHTSSSARTISTC